MGPLGGAREYRCTLLGTLGGATAFLGASGRLHLAYAAWDFNGKPGYKEIDGLVLIGSRR